MAVLPFKPLAPGGRDEVLEVGMADTLIARLANIRELTVRPLGAVRNYGGLDQDPLAAGRRLGVEAVLDGTVQRVGDRVGVTARLIRVGDGSQLWEGRFDTPFTDIFSAQDAISAEVAGALGPRLSGEEERRLTTRPTRNVEAYQLYLKGRYRRVVERTGAWLDRHRLMKVSYERRADIHQALLELGCALICWNYLQPGY